MQAMIITAYQDYDALVRVVRALSAHTLCFVHVDARSAITKTQTEALNALTGVHAIRRYKVNWGSISHLYALLDLCRMALADPRVTYLHLMSAQDFPTIPAQTFLARFDRETHILMQRAETAGDPELRHRYAHYHFMHWLNYRDPADSVQNWVGRIDRWQDMLHVNRKLCVPYKGLVWLSLPSDCCRFALEDAGAKRLLRRLRYAYIPEEFFFQNVFNGTPYEARIAQEPLRLCIWDEPTRGLPAVLDMGDLSRIDESGCAFARKVLAGTPLYETLERRWLGA